MMTDSDDRTYVEKFTPTDLMMLRSELLQSGVDSFQAAAIVCELSEWARLWDCSGRSTDGGYAHRSHGLTAELCRRSWSAWR